MIKACLMLVAASMLSSPAAEPAKRQAKDPNRIVCEKIEMSGSRFEKKRVCMTATEWENARQADRAAIDKIQASTCVRGAGC